MSAIKITCRGCGNELTLNGEDVKCPRCGTVAAYSDNLISKEKLQRLDIAAGYRRVGRFDDAQQELESLLATAPDIGEALFECFLNAYEITEYSFNADNTVKTCNCTSSSRRPVDKHGDWIRIQEEKLAKGAQLEQWVALSEKIEEERRLNLDIKNNIPLYRAILTCDYGNKQDLDTARGIYDILSKQTDVFFAPVTLDKINPKDKGRYLMQILKSPEIAPLMFVIYSDAFNYRNKANQFFSNIAEQCREFAKTHTMTELFSVTCDYEPSPIMKRFSIKTIRCADFDEESYQNISKAIIENIAAVAYEDDEYDEYLDGEAVMLDEELGLSPIIEPLDEE